MSSPGLTWRRLSTFGACLVAQARWSTARTISSRASPVGLPVSARTSSASSSAREAISAFHALSFGVRPSKPRSAQPSEAMRARATARSTSAALVDGVGADHRAGGRVERVEGVGSPPEPVSEVGVSVAVMGEPPGGWCPPTLPARPARHHVPPAGRREAGAPRPSCPARGRSAGRRCRRGRRRWRRRWRGPRPVLPAARERATSPRAKRSKARAASSGAIPGPSSATRGAAGSAVGRVDAEGQGDRRARRGVGHRVGRPGCPRTWRSR